MKVLLVMCVIVCMAANAGMITESASAVITSDAPDGNTNASNPEVRQFTVLGGEGGRRMSIMLLRFDLTPYAGREIVDDVDMSFSLVWAERGAEFGLYAVQKPWDERTVTWNSLIGAGGDRNAVLGDPLDVQTLGPESTVRMIYHFTIPAEIVKKWLEDPASNHGLAIVGEEPRINHLFFNRNCWNNNGRPTLNAEFIDHAPETPSNESPDDGAMNAAVTPVLQASAFFDKDAGNAHGGSWWRIGLDRACLTNVWEQQTKGRNLTAITVPDQALDYEQTYFWRVCYQDDSGRWSEWSQGTGFTTGEKPAARKAIEAAHEAAKEAVAKEKGGWHWLTVLGGISAAFVGVFLVVRKVVK